MHLAVWQWTMKVSLKLQRMGVKDAESIIFHHLTVELWLCHSCLFHWHRHVTQPVLLCTWEVTYCSSSLFDSQSVSRGFRQRKSVTWPGGLPSSVPPPPPCLPPPLLISPHLQLSGVWSRQLHKTQKKPEALIWSGFSTILLDRCLNLIIMYVCILIHILYTYHIVVL